MWCARDAHTRPHAHTPTCLPQVRIGNSMIERGAVDAALAAAEASRIAKEEAEDAEREQKALEEASAAAAQDETKPEADRDAIAAQFKASNLRLQLAKQRSERAARTMRDVRVGNSMIERGMAENSGRKATLQGELALAKARLEALDKASANIASAATSEQVEQETQHEIDRCATTRSFPLPLALPMNTCCLFR